MGAGFLALAVLLTVCGLLITHPLGHSVGRWDDQINAWFVRHRTPTGTRVTGYLTRLANTPGIVGVAVIVSLIAVIGRRARLAVLLVVGLAVELAAFLVSSYIVARPRPHVTHLGTTPSTFSWPSGHVGATFVLYGGIALIVTTITKDLLLRVLAWVLAAAVTTCVGLSRIYRGEHHLTDAIAGLVLGMGALWVGTLAVQAWTARAASEARSVAVEDQAAVPSTAIAGDISGVT